MLKTFRIHIGGQVQGVGFRPFVYNLAQHHQLNGEVGNDENGVVITLNGTQEQVEPFVADIKKKAPKAALLQAVAMEEIALIDFKEFRIAPPKKSGKINIPLTADFAICDSCKKEIQDAENRRHRYPFTTCTQCGPRYAITKKFPFEREHTSVADFEMCSNCLSEYQNPEDIRFHSQTNSCGSCGIQLQLSNKQGIAILSKENNLIHEVAQLLNNGNIVALKNTNGYLLCVDATNSQAVEKLRTKKRRATKPFALLYPDLNLVNQDFNLTKAEEEALCSRVGPIVLLEPKKTTAKKIAINVAPNLNRLGVMLPSSGLLLLLANAIKKPLVATSGNIHGSPIIHKPKDAEEALKDVADCFLHHNLDITFPLDDSVWQFTDAQRIVLRRSRGMAPNFLFYQPKTNQKVLAMGAQLKSTFAFTPNGHTYVSPYFGNLENYEVQQRFTETLQQYTQLFETLPEVILIDKHPAYESSRLGKELAQNWQLPVVEIQHHKAHFASILAEHQLFDAKQAILGVVWDGTGYGDDQAIWGGEFFTYQNNSIARIAHFEYFDVLAGDKMALEPRLSLLSLMDNDNQIAGKFSETEIRIYQKLKEKNTLKTSSVGRLFDAVASLLGVLDTNTYEGEAAMLLENIAWQAADEKVIDVLKNEEYELVPTKRILEKLVDLREMEHPTRFIAASFIHTLAMVIINQAKSKNIHTIACSGGVFQNRFLVTQLQKLSEVHQVTILFHSELSSNDENIALGQLAYYQHIKE